MNPDYPLVLSFPRRRESSWLKNSRVAGQLLGFVRFAECCSRWIPACAGMTHRLSIRQSEVKYLVFLFGAFLSAQVLASPTLPVVPLNQYLAAIDYSREGGQTGCGLRIDGETASNLWINVLVSVFIRESGTMFGMFKVFARKINMKNGVPLIQDGKVTYSSIGRIHKGWIKTDSGAQFSAVNGEGYFHNEGYMAAMEFDNAMDLLTALPQTDFRVGFSKQQDGSEKVFKFNKRITQDEADKLSSCMKNLRDVREERGKTSL